MHNQTAKKSGTQGANVLRERSRAVVGDHVPVSVRLIFIPGLPCSIRGLFSTFQQLKVRRYEYEHMWRGNLLLWCGTGHRVNLGFWAFLCSDLAAVFWLHDKQLWESFRCSLAGRSRSHDRKSCTHRSGTPLARSLAANLAVLTRSKAPDTSEQYTAYLRPVSVTALRTAFSCSGVVKGDLSVK